MTYICRSYEAEISFLDIPHSEVDPHALMPQGPWTRTSSFGKRKSSHEDNRKVWAQWTTPHMIITFLLIIVAPYKLKNPDIFGIGEHQNSICMKSACYSCKHCTHIW